MRSSAAHAQNWRELSVTELPQTPTGKFTDKLLMEAEVSEEKEQRVWEWKEDAEMGGDEAHEEDDQESVTAARPTRPRRGGDEWEQHSGYYSGVWDQKRDRAAHGQDWGGDTHTGLMFWDRVTFISPHYSLLSQKDSEHLNL